MACFNQKVVFETYDDDATHFSDIKVIQYPYYSRLFFLKKQTNTTVLLTTALICDTTLKFHLKNSLLL